MSLLSILAKIIYPILLLAMISLAEKVTNRGCTVVSCFSYGLDALSSRRLGLLWKMYLRGASSTFEVIMSSNLLLRIVKLIKLLGGFNFVGGTDFFIIG